jgi:hypothetical protein
MLSAGLEGALQSGRHHPHLVGIAPAGVVIGQHVIAGLAGNRRSLLAGERGRLLQLPFGLFVSLGEGRGVAEQSLGNNSSIFRAASKSA